MSKITPGPWMVGQTVDAYGWPVFRIRDMNDPLDRDEIDADRALIEAAPDLLAACQGIFNALSCEVDCDRTGPDASDEWKAVTAAIEKATGEKLDAPKAEGSK